MDDKERECKIILEKKDYYDILGVEKTADETQIKRAYRKLAIKFHPDKNKAKSAEEAFKKVNQAFCVLSDKTKRKNYDMFGTEEGPGISTMPDDFNPFDIFEQFFQEFGGGIGGQQHRNGGTRFSFNNGNGSFTVFSSGFGSPFFEDDDNYVNPFEDIFFGRSRTTNRERNSRNNRSSQGNRNQRSNRTNREEMRKQMESSMKNAALCIQFFPLICFLFTFIIIPWILRNIF
jgi:curved DNA-binding protein CbpA